MAWKPTVLIDWDGTIGTYDGKYVKDVVGAPMEGARAAIYSLVERDGFEVKIFTTREAEIIAPVLSEFGFPKLEITNIKSPAFVHVDDRALRFEGKWDREFLEQIRTFQPWWKTRTPPQSPQPSSTKQPRTVGVRGH